MCKSSQKQPSVRRDVTNDAPVNNDLRIDSGRQDPQLQRQMDELDRHRQMVQKMSNKVIDLHSKVCDKRNLHVATHYNTERSER